MCHLADACDVLPLGAIVTVAEFVQRVARTNAAGSCTAVDLIQLQAHCQAGTNLGESVQQNCLAVQSESSAIAASAVPRQSQLELFVRPFTHRVCSPLLLLASRHLVLRMSHLSIRNSICR